MKTFLLASFLVTASLLLTGKYVYRLTHQPTGRERVEQVVREWKQLIASRPQPIGTNTNRLNWHLPLSY